MNTNHYPAGSAGGKGGQFAPKNASGQGSAPVSGAGSSLEYAPKMTRSGSSRVFFNDLPQETQQELMDNFNLSHADILLTSDYYYDNFKTSNIDTDERDFQRKIWVNDELEEQFKNGPKKREKKAVLVLGLPGSGKSTIANPLLEQMGAFGIDADNFKERIPEFKKDPRMAGAVHQESVDMSLDMMNELAQQGYNLVASKVGGDVESVKPYMDMWEKNGYQVEVVLVDVPLQVAMDRTIGRFDRGETTRLVPLWTIKTADKEVFNTFDKLMEYPNVVGGKIYNNDVEEGQEPELLHEYKHN